jgi:hypothetical protein
VSADSNFELNNEPIPKLLVSVSYHNFCTTIFPDNSIHLKLRSCQPIFFAFFISVFPPLRQDTLQTWFFPWGARAQTWAKAIHQTVSDDIHPWLVEFQPDYSLQTDRTARQAR